ncbi:ABC transporter permease, partial [Dietzia sp.]|uniref:ABC transporter permease n=1 Tax=Dietzia sp. TaxID=1871616 RepID=UPI002FDB4D95
MAGIREDPREDHRKEPRDTLHAVDPAGEANAEPQTETQAQAQDPQPSPWPRALLTGVLGAVIVSLVVLAFLWPSFASEPKNLPVQVVASEQEYEQFTAQTEKASAARGTALPFSFVRADSRDAAVDAITHRDAYGAFVLPSGPDGQMEVLTAKAANTQVAPIITSAAQNMAKGQAAQIPADAPAEQRTAAMDKALEGPTITDVAPLPEADPNGTGLALSSLPLTIGGIIGGVVTAFTLKGTWRRLAGVLTYTVVGSLALYLVLDVWFEFLPAPFALEWLAIGMSL